MQFGIETFMENNQDLVKEGMKRYPYCPICGNGARSESTRGISSIKSDTGRLYLQYTADKLMLSIKELLEKIQLFTSVFRELIYAI